MANLGYKADPTKLEETFEVVPAGDYTAIITHSDYQPNKKGTGMTLKLTYEVLDAKHGDFKGRKLFETLNLKHENPQTVAIAQKSLNSICLALGMATVEDSEQLHNKPMLLVVAVQPPQNGYDQQNKIKKHLALSGSAPAAGGFTPPAQGSEMAPKPGKKAWEK